MDSFWKLSGLLLGISLGTIAPLSNLTAQTVNTQPSQTGLELSLTRSKIDGSGRIDLLVNRQNWNSLDYIQQYEFVHHFGTDAMDRGYNLRVLNEQKQLLATYTCDFSNIPTQCNIVLDATSRSMIRGGSQFGMVR